MTPPPSTLATRAHDLAPRIDPEPRRPRRSDVPVPELSPAARRAAERVAARTRHTAELAELDRRHRQRASARLIVRPWRWQGGVHARRRAAAFLVVATAAWVGIVHAQGATAAAHGIRHFALRAAHVVGHDASRADHHAGSAVRAAVSAVAGGPTTPLTHSIERDVHIPAPSLHGSTDALILLPVGYTTAHHYPVLYLLHGQPDTPEHMVSLIGGAHGLDSDVRGGVLPPTIIVVPRGPGDPSTDSEWDNAPGGAQWGSFVTRDLIQYVDHHYATRADAADRAVAGVAMGGYGAVNLALRNPNVFGTVSSWSGYFDATSQTAGGGPGSSSWKDASPLQYLSTVAAQAKQDGLAISLYAGSDDPFVGENRIFGQALSAAGIDHRFRIVSGAHTDAVWTAQVPTELRWIGQRFSTRS